MDNFISVQVVFLATGNQLSAIPAPLLDRLEVIHLSGYTLDEKARTTSWRGLCAFCMSQGLKLCEFEHCRCTEASLTSSCGYAQKAYRQQSRTNTSQLPLAVLSSWSDSQAVVSAE